MRFQVVKRIHTNESPIFWIDSQKLYFKAHSHKLQVAVTVALDCDTGEIENFLSPCRNATVCHRLHQICSTVFTSGQSYKQFTIVIYNSRVVIWGNFKSCTTLEL